jgi:hypothetical protein
MVHIKRIDEMVDLPLNDFELDNNDRNYLLKNGCDQSDVDEVMNAVKYLGCSMNGHPITIEDAIDYLGREEFLNGLKDAAFNRVAYKGKNGEVEFNCTELFD